MSVQKSYIPCANVLYDLIASQVNPLPEIIAEAKTVHKVNIFDCFNRILDQISQICGKGKVDWTKAVTTTCCQELIDKRAIMLTCTPQPQNGTFNAILSAGNLDPNINFDLPSDYSMTGTLVKDTDWIAVGLALTAVAGIALYAYGRITCQKGKK